MLSNHEPVPEYISPSARAAIDTVTHVDRQLYAHAQQRFADVVSQYPAEEFMPVVHNIARVARELQQLCDEGVGVALCMWYHVGDRSIASLMRQHGEVDW